MGGPRPVRVGGDAEDVDVAAADFDDEQAVQALQRYRAVQVKEVASAVAACACRKCRQVVLVRHFGAGGILSALRTRRIVDAPTRWPSLSRSP